VIRQAGQEVVLARSKDRLGLRVFGGSPVWPIQSAQEMEFLRTIADECALKLRLVDEAETDSVTTLSSGEAMVLSLGNELSPYGRLYAHLTGRGHLHCDDVTQIPPEMTIEVVIAASATLDERLLDRLYESDASAVPGILMGRGEELRRSMLRCALYAAPALPGPLPSLLFFAETELEGSSSAASVVAGSNVEPEALTRYLSRRWGLAGIVSHGDGVDCKLIPRRTLCSVVGGRMSDPDRVPLCVATGECHRQSMNIRTAQEQGLLIATESLAARVLVLYTCQGLLHPAATVANHWGLASSIAANPGVGALITTGQMTLTHPSGLVLFNHLLSRYTAGQAVAMFNGTAFARNLGNRFYLLGEPRTRARLDAAPPAEEEAREEASELRDLPVPSADVATTSTIEQEAQKLPGDLQFLRCLLPRNDPDGAGRVLRRLGDLGPRRAASAELRKELLGYALEGGIKSTAGWMWVGQRWTRSNAPFECFTCGRRCTVLDVDLRLPEAQPRRVVVCPRCGMINDTPRACSVRFSVEPSDGSVHWTEGRPSEDWAAGVFVRGRSSSRCWGFEWPVGSDGAPAIDARAARPLPEGPLRVYLYSFCRDQVSIAMAAVRVQPPAHSLAVG
jgi:hypothetical protein